MNEQLNGGHCPHPLTLRLRAKIDVDMVCDSSLFSCGLFRGCQQQNALRLVTWTMRQLGEYAHLAAICDKPENLILWACATPFVYAAKSGG